MLQIELPRNAKLDARLIGLIVSSEIPVGAIESEGLALKGFLKSGISEVVSPCCLVAEGCRGWHTARNSWVSSPLSASILSSSIFGTALRDGRRDREEGMGTRLGDLAEDAGDDPIPSDGVPDFHTIGDTSGPVSILCCSPASFSFFNQGFLIETSTGVRRNLSALVGSRLLLVLLEFARTSIVTDEGLPSRLRNDLDELCNIDGSGVGRQTIGVQEGRLVGDALVKLDEEVSVDAAYKLSGAAVRP
jgi:hypothetical protein